MDPGGSQCDSYKHSLESLHVSNASLDLVNMPTLFGPEHCQVMCPSIFLCYILYFYLHLFIFPSS